MKLAFEVLDLENSSSFETFGLGCGDPYILKAGVANSASRLPRVLYIGCRSKTRPLSVPYSLHWLTLRLKFLTLVLCLLFRISISAFAEF